MANPSIAADRVTSLDAVRGVAVFGILLMNAVSFGLRPEAYFNISADGMSGPLDWVIGTVAEVFIDQKMMALFSMLFGASVVLFYDRLASTGRSPVRISLWRNFLLLVIGIVHSVIWVGDVLSVYAICAPFVLLCIRLPVVLLFLLGGFCALSSAFTAAYFQQSVPANGAGLESIWTAGDEPSLAVLTFVLQDIFGRAFGYMLIGVALYRSQIITGARSASFYRRTIIIGILLGTPLAVYGVYNQFAHDFHPSIALIGEIPNTFATAPIALAWMSCIILWNGLASANQLQTNASTITSARPPQPGKWQRKIQAVGKMALSNYNPEHPNGLRARTAIYPGRTIQFN